MLKHLFFDLHRSEKWSQAEMEATLALGAAHARHFALASCAQSADAVITLNESDHRNPSPCIRRYPDRPVFCWDAADHPTGLLSGLYCSMSRPAYQPHRHENFTYPFLYNEQVDLCPQQDAERLVSFMGGITAPIRRRIVATLEAHPDEGLAVVQGGPWEAMFDRSGMDKKAQYVRVLRNTKFFVCPRGNGVGSIRLFETMKAGRVPVIVSDRFALPLDIDWQACAILVPENRIEDLVDLCRARAGDWAAMAAAARAAYDRHFGDYGLIDSIGTRLSRLTPSSVFGSRRSYWLLRGEHFAKRAATRLISAARARG